MISGSGDEIFAIVLPWIPFSRVSRLANSWFTEVVLRGRNAKRLTSFCAISLQISPWHDIPLKAGDGVYNFIVEIPKESSAKFEVATDEPNTPIKQDTKKGKLRFYPYVIPPLFNSQHCQVSTVFSGESLHFFRNFL